MVLLCSVVIGFGRFVFISDCVLMMLCVWLV